MSDPTPHVWDDSPLTAAEIAAAARAEDMLKPLADYYRAQREEAADLAAMADVEPIPLEQIPLKLREALLGPQRQSLVTVEVDGATLQGRVERYEPETNTLEVDFHGWYGEFQITHSVADVRLNSTGALVTSRTATPPKVRA
jgi:hypothetical protein